MKVALICIGKVRQRQVQELIDGYSARIAHYYPFELVAIPDVRLSHVDADRQKEAEGQRLLAEVSATDTLVLFDERGKEYTSRELAAYLERQNASSRRLVLAIGGPYGFSKAVYDRANGMLSLSRLTLPHELARLLATEQLYRAGTILRGEPYHHD